MATSGLVDITMTHPFKVLSLNDNDKNDLYLMHNGVLSHYKSVDGKSDTALFSEDMSKIFRENPSMVDSLWKKENLIPFGEEIGYGNKIVFMKENGKVAIINENNGFWKDGMWFSNSYSIMNNNY